MSTLLARMQARRGVRAHVLGVTDAASGEFFWTVDTHEVLVGKEDGTTMVPTNFGGGGGGGGISDAPSDGNLYARQNAAWALISLSWSAITGKPSTFAPSAHASNHAPGGGDAVLPANAAGWLHDDGAGGLTWSVPAWGDVTGKPSIPGTRSTVTFTTATIAAGASDTGTFTVPPSYEIQAISTDHPAWVRLYMSSAYRTADAGRDVSQDPSGDHGVMAEVVTTGSVLSLQMSPVADGFDPAGGTTGYFRVDNLDTVSRAITVTMRVLNRE